MTAWRRLGSVHAAAAIVVALAVAAVPAFAEITNPTGVAVIIGNKTYQGGLPQVDFAHNDADAFLAFVVDVLGFDPENIIDLRDTSKAQLEAAFGNDRSHEGILWSYLDPRGTSDVVVFYSGHGVPSLKDERGYLLPVDADPNIPEINGFPVDLLYENLGKLAARSIAVYLDACFSDNSHGGALIQSTSGLGIAQKLPDESTGMTVLTAARGDQVASWDEAAGHGMFTKYLLEAMRGAADTEEFGIEDDVVSLGEVQAYLDLHMTRAARREFIRNQNATAIGDPGAVLAAVQVAPTPPPPPEPQAEQVVGVGRSTGCRNVRPGQRQRPGRSHGPNRKAGDHFQWRSCCSHWQNRGLVPDRPGRWPHRLHSRPVPWFRRTRARTPTRADPNGD